MPGVILGNGEHDPARNGTDRHEAIAFYVTELAARHDPDSPPTVLKHGVRVTSTDLPIVLACDRGTLYALVSVSRNLPMTPFVQAVVRAEPNTPVLVRQRGSDE